MAKLKISKERAQDWISSVLNPIVDGVRRELRFVPSGPWRWLPQTRDFELMHQVRDYVPEIYVDNYEDFIEKRAELAPDLDGHDAALAELRHSIGRGFDRLARAEEGEAFRRDLKTAVQPKGVDDVGQDYFMAYLASGYESLSDAYSSHEVYNELSAKLRADAEVLLKECLEEARRAGAKLEQIDRNLLEKLRAVRTEIADRYGARIVPVDEY